MSNEFASLVRQLADHPLMRHDPFDAEHGTDDMLRRLAAAYECDLLVTTLCALASAVHKKIAVEVRSRADLHDDFVYELGPRKFRVEPQYVIAYRPGFEAYALDDEDLSEELLAHPDIIEQFPDVIWIKLDQILRAL